MIEVTSLDEIRNDPQHEIAILGNPSQAFEVTGAWPGQVTVAKEAGSEDFILVEIESFEVMPFKVLKKRSANVLVEGAQSLPDTTGITIVRFCYFGEKGRSVEDIPCESKRTLLTP